MRAPVAALFGSVLGMAFLLVGLALMGWAIVTKVDTPKGFDAAMSAAVWIPLPEDRVKFANSVINSLIPIAVLGLVSGVIGISMLNRSRIALRPANESTDGEGRIELSSGPPRVGASFDGTVLLGPNAAAGERFKLRIQCIQRRAKRDGGPWVVHSDSLEVTAMPGANGARLPFHFDIPSSAPATGGGPATGCYWDFLFVREKEVFGSTFELTVGA